MAKTMTSFLMGFLDVDALCALAAKAIALILSYASKRGGKAWDKAKAAVVKINLWTSLFVQVYEDDTLDEKEEKKIAKAIKS